MPRVVVVTDSTASLPAELAQARDIRVVPLQVVIGARVLDEGPDGATPDVVAEALRDFVPVSTSRPAPALFTDLYRSLEADGVEEIVSVHLSGEMSGTFESAQLAAREASIPVTAVDTRQVGIATGYAVLAAADVLDADGTAAEAAEGARARAAASSSLFYVDTLEYLRRGGRIGAAAALFGGALAVKPLLTIEDGIHLSGASRILAADRMVISALALDGIDASRTLWTGADDNQAGDAQLAGANRDELRGLAGDDRLDGGAGDDVLLGGAGADTLLGGGGRDQIGAGGGRDVVAAGAGNDVVRVRGGGADQVSCGPGRDLVYADSSDSIGSDCERVQR